MNSKNDVNIDGAAVPGKRRRRHHRRSRAGCRSCKERHMRCDEGKPFCRNCLRNGSSCGYTGVEDLGAIDLQQFPTIPSEMSSGSLHAAYLNQPSNSLPSLSTLANMMKTHAEVSPETIVQSPLTSGFGFEILEPFGALPAEMSQEAFMLLDHFNNYRVLLREPVRRPPGGEMYAWTISDGALLNATLVLAAKHWSALGGSKRRIESTLYHHKTEAIRLVNERLADPVSAVADGTVGAVGILVFVECLEGSAKGALIHFEGLSKMVQLRGDLHSPNMHGMLQRIILLADLQTATINKSKPRFLEKQTSRKDEIAIKTPPLTSKTISRNQHLDESFYRDLGLHKYLVKMFMDLHRLSSLMANCDKGILTDEIAEVEKYIDTMLRGGNYGDQNAINGSAAENAFIILSAYIYLYLSLRRIEVSSRIYDWMVDLLREALGKVAHTMRKDFPPELLFWVLWVGASASLRRRELDWFKKELRVSKEILGLKVWPDARTILTKFAWVEGWNEATDEELWHQLE